MADWTNPFLRSGTWYKANFHTHTTESDGQLSVPDRVEQYRRGGYDVLAITDHRVRSDVRGLSDKKMLVLGGMEFHPPGPLADAGPWHFVAVHIPPEFAFSDPDHVETSLREVRDAGGVNILAHPFWCGFSYRDFEPYLPQLDAVEVYNSTCDRIGRPCSENEWSYTLDRGWPLPAVASDDVHGMDDEDVMEGWTWLKLKSRTPAEVLRAIRQGCCYASCGPKIHDFRIRDGKATLRCSPVQSIYFLGRSAKGGRRRRAEEGKAIRSFTADLPRSPFVRAVVVDSRGRRAWTNPITTPYASEG